MAYFFSKKISKIFCHEAKKQRVLDEVTYSFEKGMSYAITGASGSGKSTLLHILGGLDTPTSGDVFVENKKLSSMKPHERNQFFSHKIGFVFQFHYLIKELTILENVFLAGVIKGEAWGRCKKKAEKVLSEVGLQDKYDAYPHMLSGGEQQRVSLVRALFNEPDFLLADEPTGNLDKDNAREVVDLMLAHQEKRGMGLIICTHDKNVYEKMGTVIRLDNGKLVNE